jgi:penicillin-binding protein-related factor A (putative recombinase)
MVEWQHSIYRATNRALMYHNGTRAAIKKTRGGEIRAVPQKSRPDYSGVLTALGGRYCSFDAKLTAKATYYHPTDRLHQLVDLWDVHAAGGVAFLLVSINLAEFFVLWPQSEWQWGKFVPVKLRELRGAGIGLPVEIGGSNQLPDWLSVVEYCS